MSTSVDYSGRDVDLLIFQNASPVGERKLYLGFGEGLVITGIQLLCQRYAMLFLTELGTVFYRPGYGTEFVTAMRQGAIRDEADVQSNFAIANELIRQQLLLDAVTTPPVPDELFASAKLLSFILDKPSATLTLKVSVSSSAGASRELFLPVPTAIR